MYMLLSAGACNLALATGVGADCHWSLSFFSTSSVVRAPRAATLQWETRSDVVLALPPGRVWQKELQ